MIIDKEGWCICEITLEVLWKNWNSCTPMLYSQKLAVQRNSIFSSHTLGHHPPGSSKLNVKHCQRAMCRVTEQVPSYSSGWVRISWVSGQSGHLVFWPPQAMGAAQLFGSWGNCLKPIVCCPGSTGASTFRSALCGSRGSGGAGGRVGRKVVHQSHRLF